MILQVDKSFEKDIKKQKDPSLNKRVLKLIEKLQKNDSIDQISSIKKLAGEESLYRIRIGDYRIGLELQEGKITLIRCLHRKDIYKYFPK
ncbi:MAG: plasmid stabilization protein [Flavobacteriales bacterium]|nr:plasmid stabilization protein [Flavobacteriales bacterium]